MQKVGRASIRLRGEEPRVLCRVLDVPFSRAIRSSSVVLITNAVEVFLRPPRWVIPIARRLYLTKRTLPNLRGLHGRHTSRSQQGTARHRQIRRSLSVTARMVVKAR